MRRSGYEDRPDYRITLQRCEDVMIARHGHTVLAVSPRAILLDEQDHARVVYFPAADLTEGALAPVAGHTSWCPFKGVASYRALAAAHAAPIAWCYEAPLPQMAAIAGYVAFDTLLVSVGPQGQLA